MMHAMQLHRAALLAAPAAICSQPLAAFLGPFPCGVLRPLRPGYFIPKIVLETTVEEDLTVIPVGNAGVAR